MPCACRYYPGTPHSVASDPSVFPDHTPRDIHTFAIEDQVGNLHVYLRAGVGGVRHGSCRGVRHRCVCVCVCVLVPCRTRCRTVCGVRVEELTECLASVDSLPDPSCARARLVPRLRRRAISSTCVLLATPEPMPGCSMFATVVPGRRPRRPAGRGVRVQPRHDTTRHNTNVPACVW